MKFLIVAALCLTVSAVFATTVGEVKAEVKEATKKCMEKPEISVDKEALKKFIQSKGKEAAPENLDQLALCVTKSINWQNEDGSINRQHMIDRIRSSVEDKAAGEEIINSCLVEQNKPEETARFLFKCFYEHH